MLKHSPLTKPKQTYYRIQFASFSPIFVWEWNAQNAVIRAKYQRLEEGLSTDVWSVQLQKDDKWIDCGICDFVKAEAAFVEAKRAATEREKQNA